MGLHGLLTDICNRESNCMAMELEAIQCTSEKRRRVFSDFDVIESNQSEQRSVYCATSPRMPA